MSDMKSADSTKAAVRQTETPLSRGAQNVRSPSSTPGSVTKSPKPLNVNTNPSNGNR